jgi:predicted ATPase
MKILITGSMGVGKTTLTNMLGEVKKIDVLPEVAREMIEEGFDLGSGITEGIEREILNRQILLELSEDDFIADRGIIDILAYCMVIFGDNTELLNHVNKWLSKAHYDIVFYLPPEFPLEDDGVRTTDIEFQKNIDEAIKFILKSVPFKWYEIRGTKEERLNKVLDKLLVIKK